MGTVVGVSMPLRDSTAGGGAGLARILCGSFSTRGEILVGINRGIIDGL